MQKEAQVQKTKINDAFDKMKVKGKMDPNIMEKLGFNTASKDRNSVRSVSPPDSRELGVRSGRVSAHTQQRLPSKTGGRFRNEKGFKSAMVVKPAISAPKMATSVKVGKPASMAKNPKLLQAQTAKREMDSLRKKFNDELLQILEDEQQKEN